ncbi:MAG TPA: WD40 repeat domain-containing protein [Xanthobacteraceae bacterium]|nr:WD40 repeat domain-containing protein [Xanthobacteraceae bacterium]
MTDAQQNTPSLTEKTTQVNADAPIFGVHFLGDTAAFVLGEEKLFLVGPGGEERRIDIHGGAVLASACDGRRVVTGGDDGRIVAVTADGTVETLGEDGKRRWIDRLALGPDGAVAWSAGRDVTVRTAKGELRATEAPTSPGGLAFAPKGFRLAIAHYNGVTLWFPNAAAKPETLEWKGSHLDVTFSPDGRFLITSMQEPMLHGWRLTDGKDMRMAGYAGRVRSLSWSAEGKWLATSGATQLVIWPFQGKDGPMGKQPRLAAPGESRVEQVAYHPSREVVAAGFSDGLVLLIRTEDAAEILVRRPDNAPVTALAWNTSGALLAWGTETGEAGLLDLS